MKPFQRPLDPRTTGVLALDPRRHERLIQEEPHLRVEAWRSTYLDDDTPPPGYLPEES